MLDDEIVGLPSLQHVLDVIHQFKGELSSLCDYHGHLFMHNYLRVVRHAVGNDILSLEKINTVIVDADVTDILCDVHS